jgi:hypothetical protein
MYASPNKDKLFSQCFVVFARFPYPPQGATKYRIEKKKFSAKNGSGPFQYSLKTSGGKS